MKEVKELEFDKEVLKRIEMICRFACVKPIIKQGSIINIKGTNLNYIEPHGIITNSIMFFDPNYSNEIYINNLSKEIKISELENYIKIMN